MLLRIFTEPQEGADYEHLLHVAKTAENLGFDGFFRSDHHLNIFGGDGLPGPTHSWSTLAGLARETRRITLGTLMTAATFQSPGPLASTVATVDRMSRGRVEFGFGAGWFQAEHDAYGIPFPAVGERFDRFEEQLEIITGLWETPIGGTFDFDGKHYQLHDSPGLPKPYSGRPPLIIGGSGPTRTPRLVATYADEYNFIFRPPPDTAEAFRRVRDACEHEGRTRELRLSVAQELCCGRTDAEVARRAEAVGRDLTELRERGVVGSPGELVDKIGRFAEIGCDRVYLRVLDLHDMDHLYLVASEVLPQL